MKSDIPPEVEAMFAEAERQIEVRNQIPVGVLFNSISEEHLGDRQATSNELLRVADVGVELFYAAIAHRDATPEILEEAREHWGPLVDVALEECGLTDPVI
jgi:chaperone required for assembly of F1-ATPase